MRLNWKIKNVPISFKIEMLPWEEVNNIIPNKTKFTIIDIETGLTFKVQRRAGSRPCRCTAVNQGRYSDYEENL